MIKISRLLLLACSLLTLPAFGAEFHVSPSGTAQGDGSEAHPWDLSTALAHPAAVKPGDTLWLHGGTYKGAFVSELKGTKNAPIIVRQAPKERAIISLEFTKPIGPDLNLKGEHTRYQGFEVTCEDPKRRTEIKGSWPEDLIRGSVQVRGHHLQLVNLIIHDLGSGVGYWSEGEGGELNGCIIYHNGWNAPDRGHGHGIYAQNERGTKKIVDCVLFNQFGLGMQVYGSSKASIKGFYIAGNIAFNNGSLERPNGMGRNILVGGETPMEDVLIEHNYSWNTALQIGYPWGLSNRQAVARNNYLHGQTAIYHPGQLQFENNTMICDDVPLMVQLGEQTGEGLKFKGNEYVQVNPRRPVVAMYAKPGNKSFDSAAWKSDREPDAAIASGKPAEAKVFVRPNQFEPGRAHVAVFNWPGGETVPLDLKEVLKKGQKFQVHSMQNLWAEPVLKGTWDGTPVSLPMTPVKPVQPVGMPDYPLMVTEPAFGAFLVTGG